MNQQKWTNITRIVDPAKFFLSLEIPFFFQLVAQIQQVSSDWVAVHWC